MKRSAAVPTARELFFTDARVEDATAEERERAFFHALRMKNGTNKTTYSHRLDDVNDLVNQVLPARRPLDIMDVGVSSGLATVEWMDSLDRAGVRYHMTAGDVCVTAFLLSLSPSINVLVDRSGYPLQFEVGGDAVPYPIGRRRALRFPPLFLFTHAVRCVAPLLLRRQQRTGRARRLVLASPRLAARRQLDIIEDDIRVPGRFPAAFDVIRAANVLSSLYFDDRTLIAMAANLRARLRAGGILIVCRTDEADVNHGTIFRATPGNDCEIVRRFGQGADCEALIGRAG